MSGPSALTSGSTMTSTLWAHLLNKDPAPSGSGLKTGSASVGLTASAPADKIGTSVRVLLHDTQATIEKFSERVDRLVSEAEESRQKLLARNEEINDEVERLVKRTVQEQVGRAEKTLQSCIREPAQTSALTELRQSISSSLAALNQRVEAVQNLVHVNTQTLQTINDQQFQILTAIVPLLPMLQKVPLHIASTEANLKETIWKSLVTPIASAKPASPSSISGSRKRKLSKSAEQQSPLPSVTKRGRTHADPGRTAQQLPSPKSSRDLLPARGDLHATNQHRTLGDAVRSGSRSFSRSIGSTSIGNTQTQNPDQRASMRPPIPKIVPTAPSRAHSVALLDRITQLTSPLSHKKEVASDASAVPRFARPASNPNLAPVPPNHPKDAFEAPSPFYIHTPLRTGSQRPNDWSARPSTLPPSSIGFSARRGKRFIAITDDDDEVFDD